MKYILKDKEVIKVDGSDLSIDDPLGMQASLQWSKWFETADRNVSKTKITADDGNQVLISTVFLGIDHGFTTYLERSHEDYQPVLFETMVFSYDENINGLMTRSST